MKDKLLIGLSESTSLSFLSKKDTLFGTYRGYNVTINSNNYIYYIDFPLKLSAEFELNKVNSFLHELTTEFKKLNYATYKNSSIQLQYAANYRKYRKPEILLSILDKIIDFAITNNLVTCCSYCGEEAEVTPFLIGNTIMGCCKNCQLEIKNTIAQEQSNFQKQSNNIVGGIVGGFIGALLGSVIWIIIAQMNYIAAIAGLAIAVCCIKGYQMFGGKLNLLGVIITSLITIIMVYLANHISLAIDIYSELKMDYPISFFDALKFVPKALEEPSIQRSFISNLVIGYLLTFVGSCSNIIHAYRQANYKIKAEEIEM
ncbi:hypothetical protein [Hathewaya massiliensis]|uniref:hypothetical protein n=1 Tax=Hathewaya massiliensis TaxID=1964382 RepID=UPI0011595895|nr:hypothetical protein [Hathewaya massiliensis]